MDFLEKKREPILKAELRYDGMDAVQHRMDMFYLGESLQGLAKIFTSAADFCDAQKYSKKRSRNYKIFAYPSVAGSHVIFSELYQVAVQTGIFSGAVPVAIGGVVHWLIARAAQRKNEPQLKAQVIDGLQKIISANKNDQILHMEKQVQWLEKHLELFYEDHHSACKKIVEPIGRTCSELKLNYDGAEISLNQKDKILINLNVNERIEEVESIGVFITGTDIRNGTCKVNVEDHPKRVNAVILDQRPFAMPHDPYSVAMASRKEIFVKATKILQGSKLKKLIIQGLAHQGHTK